MQMKRVSISTVIILISLVLLFNLSNNNFNDDSSSFRTDFKQPKLSSFPVNGKSLIVNQYANISQTYRNVKSGENVSYTLYNDWVSQNTTINYEGVAQKRNILTNGTFDTPGHIPTNPWKGTKWDQTINQWIKE